LKFQAYASQYSVEKTPACLIESTVGIGKDRIPCLSGRFNVSHKLFCENTFGVGVIFGGQTNFVEEKKMAGQRYVCVVGANNCLGRNNLFGAKQFVWGKTICLGRKHYFWMKTLFWGKNIIFGRKQYFVDPKKCWAENNVREKKLGPEKICFAHTHSRTVTCSLC
jgi:hypothetical protein